MSRPQRPLSGAESPAVGTVTPVGVDVGFRNLVVAAPAHGRPADAFTIEGAHLRESLDALEAVLTSFAAVEFDTAAAETTAAAAVWDHRLKGQLYDAAYRTVRWAREFPGPILVVEDLDLGAVPLSRWWRNEAFEAQTWAVNALSRALVDVAVEAGLPVARVDPAGTSTECHRCGQAGERGRTEFACTSDDCPVEAVDADVSAALTIASRI